MNIPKFKPHFKYMSRL
jgi:hypothetical protein